MTVFLMCLYSVIFSALTNCFVFAAKPYVLAVFIATFVLLNIFAGFYEQKNSPRLRLLCHGTILLVAFCVSLVISIVSHALLAVGVISHSVPNVLFSAVFCAVSNAVLFWNGIISVYLSSIQLGIKIRILGIIFGMFPVVNLIFLGIIIKRAYGELSFEGRKERINRKRRDQKICNTKYPLLLVHGVFFRDNKHLNYWGRIPAELEANGAVCYYGNHSSAASVSDSGEELARRIREIVEETGCEKVNIIAHSKGGLDSRFAISNCDISSYVASVTTVSTPHRGCLFAEWLLDSAAPKLKETVAASYNKAARLMGDREPDFLSAVSELTADFCREFDMDTKTPEGIYCQSIGSVMQRASSGRFPLNLSYNFVKRFDGKNDGLVGVEAFEWGESFELLEPPVKRGISHADMIDLNRENIKGFDVREFYVNLVSELREKGL